MFIRLLKCALFFLALHSLMSATPSVLHISFHKGCIQDLQEVAGELGLNITFWYVHDCTNKPECFFDGTSSNDNVAVKYNIGHDRAERIWNKHKVFFDQFDVIVTSDTAPLCRIFLQHKWKKPLIIWICNRFDYCDQGSLDCVFPDQQYYDFIRQATEQKNVRLIAYTPFEHVYMRRKGIEMGTFTIKPVGIKEKIIPNFQSAIPANVNAAESLFIFPRLTEGQIHHVKQGCAAEGIQTWSGVYNVPEDLSQFKGVLFFPYQFSNLALFENLQRGIVHFVPTMRFLTQLFGVIRDGTQGNLQWMEWYLPENEDCLIYFDSWDELRSKIVSLDYLALKKKICEKSIAHREEMLLRWRTVFNQFGVL